MNIYLFLIFIVGIIIYYKDKGFIPCYWFILQTVFLPVTAYFANVVSDDQLGPAYGKVNAVLSMLLLFFIFIELNANKKKQNHLKIPLLGTALLITVSFLGYVYHSSQARVLDILYSQRIYLFYILIPLYLFVVSKTTRKHIVITLLVVIAIELIIELLNHLFGIHLYMYHMRTSLGVNLDVFTSGTFRRFSNLAAFYATIQLFLSNEYLIKRRIKPRFFYAMSLFIGFGVIITGSRNGLYVYFFSLIVPAIIGFQKNVKFIFVILVSAVFLLSIIFSFENSLSSMDENSGLIRNLVGIKEKVDKRSFGYGAGTDNLNYELIERYFNLEPFGLGKTINSNRLPNEVYGGRYSDDAKIAYFFVEYGWLPFLCLILFWISFYKYYVLQVGRKNSKLIITSFISLLLLSITDEGIFSTLLFSMVAFYAYYITIEEHTHAKLFNIRNKANSILTKY